MAAPFNEIPLALAFGAGLVASVNPCGFALLPSLLVYYLGSDGDGKSGAARVSDGLVVGLVLAAGFMLVFGSAGILFGLGAHAIVRFVPWFALVMGVAMAVLGGWLLTGRNLMVRMPGYHTDHPPSDYRSLFLFGIAYAVGSISCTLPVFLLVVTSSLATGSVVSSLAVFVAYGLGMATILMLLCLGTAGFREIAIRRIRGLYPHLTRISGALLVVGGAYITYYWTSLLSGRDDGPAIRLVQELQRGAQSVLTSLDDRVWLVVGVALAAAAAMVLAHRLLGQEEQPSEGDAAAAASTEQARPRVREGRL